jgi:putative transposase
LNNTTQDLFSEAQWKDAHRKLNIIRPFLDEGAQIAEISRCEGVPLRTLWRWVCQYKENGLTGLVRGVRADKGKGPRISNEMKGLIEGLALRVPRLSVKAIQRQLLRHIAPDKEAVPSYSTIYNITRSINPALKTLAHEGRQAYINKFDLVYRREAEGSNSIWQADHTELDVLIKYKDTLQKPWLTIILDDYSRAVAGYALSFSAPSAIQTALAFRNAIWHKERSDWEICGIPDIFYTDHGSDFTSRHIEQVAISLKSQLIFSAVAQPRGRGKIERFFQSLQQMLLPHLPGHQPPGSKANSKSFLTLSQLGERLEQFIIEQYHTSPHSETKLSPHNRWREGGFLPRLPESRSELDLLLLTVAKSRRVQNDGIKFEGFRYMDSALAGYVGESVVVRYDPRDMAEISVFYQNAFVCRAVCTELSGKTLSLSEIVSARRKIRQQLQGELKDKRKMADVLMDIRTGFFDPEMIQRPDDDIPPPPSPKPKLKRFYDE